MQGQIAFALVLFARIKNKLARCVTLTAKELAGQSPLYCNDRGEESLDSTGQSAS